MSSLSIFAEACPCCHFLFRISGCQFLQENWSALSIFARKFVRFVIFCKWHQQFWSGGQAVGSRPNTALSHTLWNSKIFKTFFLKYIKKAKAWKCYMLGGLPSSELSSSEGSFIFISGHTWFGFRRSWEWHRTTPVHLNTVFCLHWKDYRAKQLSFNAGHLITFWRLFFWLVNPLWL